MIADGAAGVRDLSVGLLLVHPSCLDVGCLRTFPMLARPFARRMIRIRH